mmetsp:Transcript_11191/g.22697  ORF Transcript_11191/g.22697 Transcript_11191/m.22697 type:complete len:245 (-) Transcript_11191:246-980(-)
MTMTTEMTMTTRMARGGRRAMATTTMTTTTMTELTLGLAYAASLQRTRATCAALATRLPWPPTCSVPRRPVARDAAAPGAGPCASWPRRIRATSAGRPSPRVLPRPAPSAPRTPRAAASAMASGAVPVLRRSRFGSPMASRPRKLQGLRRQGSAATEARVATTPAEPARTLPQMQPARLKPTATAVAALGAPARDVSWGLPAGTIRAALLSRMASQRARATAQNLRRLAASARAPGAWQATSRT